MRVLISESDLPAIKAHLRHAHPGFKPSQRIEAASAGLGFTCYAAMRSALKADVIEVAADDRLFAASLGLPYIIDEYTTERALSRAVGFVALHRVLDQHPELTERGFDSIWQGQNSELRKPIPERQGLLRERRQEAYQSNWAVDQFELGRIFLSRQRKIKTLNRSIGSYGLKHRAEDLSRKFDLFRHLGNYVSNGMLIAAAYADGFAVKRMNSDSYNAYLNISMETLKRARGWHPRAPRPIYGGDGLYGEPSLIAAMYGELPRALDLPKPNY